MIVFSPNRVYSYLFFDFPSVWRMFHTVKNFYRYELKVRMTKYIMFSDWVDRNANLVLLYNNADRRDL